jgi:hypothetical protein
VTVISSPEPDLHQERRVKSMALLGSGRLVIHDCVLDHLSRRPSPPGNRPFQPKDERFRAFDLTRDGIGPCIWTIRGERTGPCCDAMVGAEDDLFISFNSSSGWPTRILRLRGETGSLIAMTSPRWPFTRLTGLHVQESRAFFFSEHEGDITHDKYPGLLSYASCLDEQTFRASKVEDVNWNGGIAPGGKGELVVLSKSQPGKLLVLSLEGTMLRSVHSPVMRMQPKVPRAAGPAHNYANLQAAGRLMLVRATGNDLCVEDGPSAAVADRDVVANAHGNTACEVVALKGETVVRYAYLAAEATCEATRV